MKKIIEYVVMQDGKSQILKRYAIKNKIEYQKMVNEVREITKNSKTKITLAEVIETVGMNL